jgi:hypothetical protein
MRGHLFYLWLRQAQPPEKSDKLSHRKIRQAQPPEKSDKLSHRKIRQAQPPKKSDKLSHLRTYHIFWWLNLSMPLENL